MRLRSARAATLTALAIAAGLLAGCDGGTPAKAHAGTCLATPSTAATVPSGSVPAGTVPSGTRPAGGRPSSGPVSDGASGGPAASGTASTGASGGPAVGGAPSGGASGRPAGGGAAGGIGAVVDRPLPSARLDCLDGTGDVRLTTAGRPTLVSFWASYCQPCRDELPLLQHFAATTEGRLGVVGVDTADLRSHGRALASELKLSFPLIEDPDSTLSKSVGIPGLPTLLFVAADGRIEYMLATNHLDLSTLSRLTDTYLHVSVPA